MVDNRKDRDRRLSAATNAKRVARMRSIAKTETDECILWPHKSMRITLERYTAADREICKARNGEPKWSTQTITRSCGNPACCNYRHMRWTDYARARNEPRRCAAEDIRELRKQGLFVCEIADRLKVSVEEVQRKIELLRMRYI